MDPKPWLLTDDVTRLTMVDVNPLKEYSVEDLEEMGIASHYVGGPHYSLERAERHAAARGAMALIYSQGAAIINLGLANESFTLIQVEIADKIADSVLIEMTPQQSRIAKQYQIALSKVPETKQIRSGEGHYEQNLLQVALIAKIGLAHMDPCLISRLFKQTDDHFMMATSGPDSNFDLPNGSRVNEFLVQVLLCLHIVANAQDFTLEQGSKAKTWLKRYPHVFKTLCVEVLISLGHKLTMCSSGQRSYPGYDLTPELTLEAHNFLVGLYTKERSAFAPFEEVTEPTLLVITTDNAAIAHQGREEEVKEGLQAYITKVETKYQNDFRYGFWFFKDSQAENRQANWLLAQNLLQRLNNGENVEKVFSNRKELERYRLTLLPMFHDHGIHSKDLNKVLKIGIDMAEAALACSNTYISP